MDRRGRLITVVGALALAFVALVASAKPFEMWHDPTTDLSLNFEPRQPPVRTPPPPSGEPGEGLNLPGIGVGLERILVIVLLVAMALFVAWRLRRWIAELTPEDEPDFDVLPDVQAALASDADAQRWELLRGSPRNAIVACWVRLEQCVADAGLVPDRAETSSELTARVVGTYVVDQRAIDSLAALYREARFSTHELSEAHRQRAIAALDELHAQLRRPSTVVSTGQ